VSFHNNIESIRRRYDFIAPVFPVFELVFLQPPGIRPRAVARLELKHGDSVLEVGCGTGRNLKHLVSVVGPSGTVYGVDCSEGMLEVARRRCSREGWNNVHMQCQDAAQMVLPGPVDAVLFSLSYSVMPEPSKVLARAWEYLRPGKVAVIVDAKLDGVPLSRWMRRPVAWVSKATVLGDPDILPWEHLKVLTPDVKMEEINFGTYFICRGRKHE
jgi:ubiquinone/menaquinone biosynthesis C-methylase UbiE